MYNNMASKASKRKTTTNTEFILKELGGLE